jgi:hypothetical protein
MSSLHSGICLRNLQIDTPVTALFWPFQRILAIGTDNVTEFHDSNNYKEQINRGKVWLGCHEGEIIAASIRPPDAIVTTCSHGDLIFWRFETGHPYARFNLAMPTRRIMQIVYHAVKSKKMSPPRGEINENKNLFDDNNSADDDADNDVRGKRHVEFESDGKRFVCFVFILLFIACKD